MNYLKYILRVLRPHRHRLVIAVLAMLGVTAVGLLPPLIVAEVIDGVVGRGRYDWLVPLMIALVLLPFLDAVMRWISDYTITVVSQRFVFDIRLELYDRVHRLSCRYMANTTTGKLMERLRGDVSQVQSVLTNQTLGLLVQGICALFAIGLMLFISPLITCLVLLACFMYALNYKYFVRRIRKVQRRYRRKMDLLSGMAQERLAGTIIVKAFGHEREEARRFVRANFLAERVFHRYRLLNAFYGMSSSIIAWGTYILVMVLGTRYAIMGTITYGAVTALMAYTMRLLTPAVQLAELSNQLQQARVSLDRIFELMQADPDPIHKSGATMDKLRGEVAFENLCFQYEPGKPVLRHINLYVEPGQTVALVGHTGCGKSTITNLLYRYYEPQAGHLEIDGRDISTLDTRWYRRHLALVPQEPIVFDTTIAHNIAYGRPHASRDEIIRAARAVELGEMIDRLGDGIDTKLGEYGIKLSVGERQRMCLARAILADPTILILDEATSSLDTQSETLIQLAMKRVMANRTCFVVAHRLSTIVGADQIVVMDSGRVIEMGNHAQLMTRSGGHYRHLYETQMGGENGPGRLVGVAS